MMQRVGGVSRYFLELCSHLSSLNLAETRICAGIHQNVELNSSNRHLSSAIYLDSFYWRRPTSKIIRSISEKLSLKQLNTFAPDIIHQTYYSNYQNRDAHPLVVTVYDFIHELYYPENKRKIQAKRISMGVADSIIAISDNTRKDLIRIYPEYAHKVKVVHLAASKIFHAAPTVLESQDPYVLFVGSRGGYKNFNSVLRSFAESEYLSTNFKLHVFGNQNFTKSELDLIFSLGLGDTVRYFSGGDEELLKQYQNARLFVYPSLYEGFGLPIIEAMASGCPVLSTNAGSMGEVSGEGGYFFDANKQGDLRRKLEAVLKSETLRTELINYGFINSLRFDWESTARETHKIYLESLI